jgi:hypothetical protein
MLRVTNAGYVSRQLKNSVFAKKQSFWISPNSKVSLAGQEKAPARMLGLKLGGAVLPPGKTIAL